MKIIDADKLHYKQVYIATEKGLRPALVVFAKEIRKMPEIGRCKDCKYYLNSNEKCGLVDTRLRFYETDNVWTRDGFCSWGERRENETD